MLNELPREKQQFNLLKACGVDPSREVVLQELVDDAINYVRRTPGSSQATGLVYIVEHAKDLSTTELVIAASFFGFAVGLKVGARGRDG